MHQIFSYLIQILIPVVHAETSTVSHNPAQLLGLDWKLFLAQLVNFCVVLFVLWKWAFGPLGKKLQERADKIEKSLQQAKEIEQQKEETEKSKMEQLAEARKEADEIINKAEAAATAVKEQIILEAKTQSQKLLEQVRQQSINEKEKMLAEFRQDVAEMVVSVTEKIIRSKLDPKADLSLIKKSVENVEKAEVQQ